MNDATYTRCRISEALELTAEYIDLSAKSVRFRTLKQRGDDAVYRSVPVPDDYLNAMKLVHSIQKRRRQVKGKTALLWPISRTAAWKQVKAVMAAADIEGDQATPIRCSHGTENPNPRLVQKLIGHKYLETRAV